MKRPSRPQQASIRTTEPLIEKASGGAAFRRPAMKGQPQALEVWLDGDLGPARRVGRLVHDRGQVRFHYDRHWLEDALAFAIDPDLSLDDAAFFPRPELGNFGVFLDSSPDRWGQTLMKRREALQARDESSPPRTLHAWDFLVGVQDFARQGALRFRPEAGGDFLGNEALAAPPVTTLRELEAVALELSSRHIDNLDALRRWLAVLVAPGLSGRRPAEGQLHGCRRGALDRQVPGA